MLCDGTKEIAAGVIGIGSWFGNPRSERAGGVNLPEDDLSRRKRASVSPC